jgi:thymidylate synthase
MKVIEARNVHAALPLAINHLVRYGRERNTRNGKVLQAPGPVTTVYSHPTERVLFWVERDANPFFHLYEALWMLQGRNEVLPLTRYSKNIATFAEDSGLMHGAYGYRWRRHFGIDQLEPIAMSLIYNQDDRRQVLQMWDPREDLNASTKRDLPCNTAVTFQRGFEGELNMTVFNRSNDIIWGCYGANAVHFSFLHEYMARWIGCKVGTYTQISVNWHGYLNTLAPVMDLVQELGGIYSHPRPVWNPYAQPPGMRVIPLISKSGLAAVQVFDLFAQSLTDACDRDEFADSETFFGEDFFDMAYTMFRAHSLFKRKRTQDAVFLLTQTRFNDVDWIAAGRDWLQRRHNARQS